MDGLPRRARARGGTRAKGFVSMRFHQLGLLRLISSELQTYSVPVLTLPLQVLRTSLVLHRDLSNPSSSHCHWTKHNFLRHVGIETHCAHQRSDWLGLDLSQVLFREMCNRKTVRHRCHINIGLYKPDLCSGHVRRMPQYDDSNRFPSSPTFCTQLLSLLLGPP
jgi:hypothetical protein